jgi:hypothetical protein
MVCLEGRGIQIAGSIDNDAAKSAVILAHGVVQCLSRALLERGAVLITMVDEEPKLRKAGLRSVASVFYWDVLAAVDDYLRSLVNGRSKVLARVVCSAESFRRIPKPRRDLWQRLLDKQAVSLHQIKPGWTSSYLMRKKQETLADALVALGGRQGVDQLMNLYIAQGKTVLPLDIPLGSGRNDGSGVAERCYPLAVTSPMEFIPNSTERTASRLRTLSHDCWRGDPDGYGEKIAEFLEDVVKPQVFYASLLRKSAKEYKPVRRFFKEVVDPFVDTKHYRMCDMGTSRIRGQFLNVEIVKQLNRSSIAIVDLTGLSPNCFLELGYVLGIGRRYILTARKGTRLPFDADKIPCFFWSLRSENRKLRKEFEEFWQSNIEKESMTEL